MPPGQFIQLWYNTPSLMIINRLGWACMKQIEEITLNSCREEVNRIGFSQVVNYQEFDALNPDVSLRKTYYEFITLPTKKVVIAAQKLGPYIVIADKSKKLKLFKVEVGDFTTVQNDARNFPCEATAKPVCSYDKLDDTITAASVLNGHLLTGDSTGKFYFFPIPVASAAEQGKRKQKPLLPLKSCREHTCKIVACDMMKGHKNNDDAGEFATADIKGIVKYWKVSLDESVWTFDLKRQIVDLRTTPTTKIVVASIEAVGSMAHITVFDQTKNIVFERHCEYNFKAFEFSFAGFIRLSGIDRLVGFDFNISRLKVGIQTLSDEQQGTTKALSPAVGLAGNILRSKSYFFFPSRDQYICLMQNRKKNPQLIVCKNDSEETILEPPKL